MFKIQINAAHIVKYIHKYICCAFIRPNLHTEAKNLLQHISKIKFAPSPDHVQIYSRVQDLHISNCVHTTIIAHLSKYTHV